MKSRFATALAAAMLGAAAGAAPPTVPDGRVVKVAVGKDTLVKVVGDGKSEFTAAPAFAPDDCTWFPGERDDGTQIFLVRPQVAKKFYVILWTVGDPRGKYETLEIDATGGTPGDPVKPPPGVDPPPPAEPPPVTAGLYFMVIRPDGPASQAFTAAIGNPGWVELVKAGHTVKDVTLSEAARLGYTLESGTTVPAVVVLRPAADGKSSAELKTVPMPTTRESILKLVEGL